MFSYPTMHTQQSSVPNARAFTKLMGAFVTFWDNDAGSKIHLLANPALEALRHPDGAPVRVEETRLLLGSSRGRA